ncbi:MAG: HEAT repeat domain-containing protein [bacterium]
MINSKFKIQNSKLYCGILGVRENASFSELKKAFHKRAAVLHPDARCGDPHAEEEFKKVTAAYQFLKSRLREKMKQAYHTQKSAICLSTSAPPHLRTPAPVRRRTDLPPDELVYRLRFSQNKYVRLHAVRELSAVKVKGAVWWLIAALSDTDREVRLEAVSALGEIGRTVAVMPLIQLYMKGDSEIRTQIVEVLERISTPLVTQFLEKVQRRHRVSADSLTITEIPDRTSSLAP